MQGCSETLSVLPERFPDLPVKDAVDLLVTKRVKDATAYFECSRKQEELARWIESKP